MIKITRSRVPSMLVAAATAVAAAVALVPSPASAAMASCPVFPAEGVAVSTGTVVASRFESAAVCVAANAATAVSATKVSVPVTIVDSHAGGACVSATLYVQFTNGSKSWTTSPLFCGSSSLSSRSATLALALPSNTVLRIAKAGIQVKMLTYSGTVARSSINWAWSVPAAPAGGGGGGIIRMR